jgi:hypothetical protein
MYIAKMEEACDRYRVFLKRLELAEDPASREFLRFMQAQMLNGGFTMQARASWESCCRCLPAGPWVLAGHKPAVSAPSCRAR